MLTWNSKKKFFQNCISNNQYFTSTTDQLILKMNEMIINMLVINAVYGFCENVITESQAQDLFKILHTFTIYSY